MCERGIVTDACEAAGIGRATAYRHREESPTFAAAWDAAYETAIDRLEQEAHRRAYEGTLKPVFYRGEECGYVREFSDQLMVELLRGNRPKKYARRVQIEIVELARKVAAEAGLDADELIREAERIASGKVAP